MLTQLKTLKVTPITYRIEFNEPTSTACELRLERDGSASLILDDLDETTLSIPNLTEFSVALAGFAHEQGKW